MVSFGEYMSVIRGDFEILSGILLLCFGDVCVVVFVVVYMVRCLLFGFLGKLRDSFDCVGDGKVVYECDVFFVD